MHYQRWNWAIHFTWVFKNIASRHSVLDASYIVHMAIFYPKSDWKRQKTWREMRTHVTRTNWQETTIWTLHRSSLFCPFRDFAQEIRNLTGFTFFLIFWVCWMYFLRGESGSGERVWGSELFFGDSNLWEPTWWGNANFIFHRNKSSL